MAVFRVEKTKDFTVMSNHHLHNAELSLKAKGLFFGRFPPLPYKRPVTKKGFHEWYKYVYDEYLDIVICPEYKSLEYSTTNRNGYREYKSLKYQCQECPARDLCTESRNCQKIATWHIGE